MNISNASYDLDVSEDVIYHHQKLQHLPQIIGKNISSRYYTQNNATVNISDGQVVEYVLNSSSDTVADTTKFGIHWKITAGAQDLKCLGGVEGLIKSVYVYMGSRQVEYIEDYKKWSAMHTSLFEMPVSVNAEGVRFEGKVIDDINNVVLVPATQTKNFILPLKACGFTKLKNILYPSNHLQLRVRLILDTPASGSGTIAPSSFATIDEYQLSPALVSDLDRVMKTGAYRLVLNSPSLATTVMQNGTQNQNLAVVHSSLDCVGVFFGAYGSKTIGQATYEGFVRSNVEDDSFQLKHLSKAQPSQNANLLQLENLTSQNLQNIHYTNTGNRRFKDGNQASHIYYMPFDKLTKYSFEDILMGVNSSIGDSTFVFDTAFEAVADTVLTCYFMDRVQLLVNGGSIDVQR